MAAIELIPNIISQLHPGPVTQIDPLWQECGDFTTINLFWRDGYTGCMFCKWTPRNLHTGPSQIGHQIPHARTRHCGPSRRLRFVGTSGMHAYWNARRIGMHWTSWDAWNNIGKQQTALPAFQTTVGWTTDKYWKTNRHMGFANTKVLPMEMFGRIGAQQLGEFPSGKQVRLDSTQLHAAQCSLAYRMHV